MLELWTILLSLVFIVHYALRVRRDVARQRHYDSAYEVLRAQVEAEECLRLAKIARLDAILAEHETLLRRGMATTDAAVRASIQIENEIACAAGQVQEIVALGTDRMEKVVATGLVLLQRAADGARPDKATGA